MALRIHFPWGWLISVVGFAALGWVGGYLLLHDLLGHLYRECLAFASAGAILGGCGWSMSERIAYAGNLNTSPLLRLAVSGVVASVIGVWVAAPFVELTVGAGPWWPEIAGAGFYLASSVLPLVGTLSVISGLEMLIIAGRADSGVLTGFRPIAPYFAVGMVLLAAVVASGIYLRGEIRGLVVKTAPDRVRSSSWADRQKRLFSQVLAGQGCQVLVAPLTAPPGVPSLDRVARSLIGRMLAAEVAAQTGHCVADPTLVSRALGASAHAEEDALALASATGASWLIRGSVEHQASERLFMLKVYASARGAGATPTWTAGEVAMVGPIEFSDELPPEAAFEPHAAALVEQLALGGEKSADAGSGQATGSVFPDSLERLAEDPGTPAGRAERLQMVAALYAPQDDGAAQLWERSLVALGPLARDDEHARVLRARAALHLDRRPYAVVLLHGLESDEARTLLAIAQSNLSDAEQTAPRIRDRAAALLTRLEIGHMKSAFGRPTADLDKELLGAYPGYAALIESGSSASGSQAELQRDLAQVLDRLGASVADDPQDLLRRWSRVAMLQAMAGDDVVRRSSMIERGYQPLWLTRGTQWRGRPAADRLAEWDVYDALYAANRTALVREAAQLRASGPAGADVALALAEGSTPLFGGFPPLAATAALALHDLNTRAASPPDESATERERRLVRDILQWEGGDDQVTRTIAALAPPPGYAHDEPPRAWRLAQLASAAAPAAIAKNPVLATELLRAVDYTRYDFSLLEQAYAALHGTAAADELISRNQQRFLGHPGRDRLLTQRAEERGDAAAIIALLEQQLREQPQDWEICLRLAKAYMASRQLDAAQRTLLSYPAFSAADGITPAAAEKAWKGGEWLLWSGQAALAQPLFAIGARDATASPGAAWSSLRLNQLAGNWRQARDWARHLHEGTAAPGALAAAAQISFLLGEPDQGWRSFYEAAKRFEDIGPWSAALVGHRIAQTTDKEVLDFTTRWKSLSGEPRVEAPIKDAFAFEALMIDRSPAPKVVEALAAFAARNGDQAHQRLAAAYDAFRRNEFAAAAERFSVVLSDTNSDAAYAMPYLVASLMRTDRREDAEALLADARSKGKHGVPVLLADAYVAGLGGDPARALDALWRAQIELAEAPAATVPPSYQVLETCEKLLELTRDDRYRQWLLYLARGQQAAWPTSWAYAFEAKYAVDAGARSQAFAMASYLDAGSAHLASASEPQRKKAAQMVAKNNPFGK